MRTSNRKRQKKWKQKQVDNGMRTVTVMLPSRIKELIDQKEKKAERPLLTLSRPPS